MDFRLSDESEAFRAEVRAFLRDAIPLELEEHLYRTGVSYDAGFTTELVERGWLAPRWSGESGDQEHDASDMLVLGEELQAADAPMYATGTTMMVAKIIKLVGTPELQQQFLPKALRGELIAVLGFSEPEAGSDVANAQTRAVRDGDEWVINGQKMFTTNGHLADYVFLLCRTNVDVPKHKGLTTFLVPMKQPGVDAQAVFTVSGERTNITYYSDVRVGDECRIGEVDRGWDVMMLSLQDEHSSGFAPRIRTMVTYVEEWARTATDDQGRPPIESPDVRRRLGRAATELEVATLLARRCAWMVDQHEVPVAEGPMLKLFSSEAYTRAVEDLTEVMGPDALRSYFEPSAPLHGRIEHERRHSLGTTIYGGTSEVQRNIIAQRGLGHPR
jgi:alkylation response protein AidB-like acyl-CoA dehydrogenase